ncbi:8-oxo-dGTP diphosphatase [Litorivivens lipolytica]|uniref:8-oxo-dGTP diphosphatase n=1 Tax=Litorivivens lipolytica TaxID=1524264 RepID=A0A7W4W4L4_9GAMM|nr:8-oxo-dGTP diphosphatase MutT [Litorivivens lipolytica]MBB3047068.1 8-oxo-dGTP diphosphatase [Litorivivens lipolytica]
MSLSTPPTAADPRRVHVAAGVILREQRVLIARRHAHAHQGGLWEFPGGKLEPGESVISALKRELQEEIGIDIEDAEPLLQIAHDYPDKQVLLDFWTVSAFSGEPQSKEGQALEWCELEDLREREFPEANVPVVDRLLELFEIL